MCYVTFVWPYLEKAIILVGPKPNRKSDPKPNPFFWPGKSLVFSTCHIIVIFWKAYKNDNTGTIYSDQNDSVLAGICWPSWNFLYKCTIVVVNDYVASYFYAKFQPFIAQ